jgi:dynein heavy chain, axonemal
VKQQVAPLQATEVANIRRKLASFDVRQHEFRDEFRKLSAFQYSCVNPYEEMDKVKNLLFLLYEP